MAGVSRNTFPLALLFHGGRVDRIEGCSIRIQLLGVPLWRSGLRIQHCCCSGLGQCYGADWIPGLGTSTCHRHSQNSKRTKTEYSFWLLTPLALTLKNELLDWWVPLHSLAHRPWLDGTNLLKSPCYWGFSLLFPFCPRAVQQSWVNMPALQTQGSPLVGCSEAKFCGG